MLLYAAAAGDSHGALLGAMTGTLTGGTAAMPGPYAIADCGPQTNFTIVICSVLARQRQALLHSRLH